MTGHLPDELRARLGAVRAAYAGEPDPLAVVLSVPMAERLARDLYVPRFSAVAWFDGVPVYVDAQAPADWWAVMREVAVPVSAVRPGAAA